MKSTCHNVAAAGIGIKAKPTKWKHGGTLHVAAAGIGIKAKQLLSLLLLGQHVAAAGIGIKAKPKRLTAHG